MEWKGNIIIATGKNKLVELQLLFAVLAGIGLLLFLILFAKIQAFIALLIASIAVGLLAGMPVDKIAGSVQTGMGGTLGFIAVVVGLGSMFGAILESSGGVHALAKSVLNKFGEKNASWGMMVIGFIVCIPVFFDVGFVMLMPVVYALQQKTGKSLLLYGIPLLAGLAVTHCFIPPTPGPVAVAEILGANLGHVILVGTLAGIPAAIIAGPIFGRYIGQKIYCEAITFADSEQEPATLPSTSMVFALIGFPLFLILVNTALTSGLLPADYISADIRSLLIFIGHPFVALIIANLLAWYILGIRKGVSPKELMEISTKSLGPAGVIILITGAGGVFKQMLTDSGAGTMLAESLTGLGMSAFVFAFISTALIRILQGSSTVAMITAAGLTANLVGMGTYTPMDKALLVIAISSGALILSHVNDSGFWLVSKYFGLSEKQTLRSWTVMTTILALTGFTAVILLKLIL